MLEVMRTPVCPILQAKPGWVKPKGDLLRTLRPRAYWQVFGRHPANVLKAF